MDRGLHVIETTFADRATADPVARRLVDEGHAVCARVGGDGRSWYRWQGELADEVEVTLHLKVRSDRLTACCDRLRELHPFTTPMILAWPVAWADPGYLDWAYGEGGD